MSATPHEQQAYDLGCEHARNAASWILDGNATQDHYVKLLAMIDAGDPQTEDYLPARPNLSGEWADHLTPLRLYEQVTGYSVEDAGVDGWALDPICDAYERGVDDTFEAECERLLRSAIES